MASNAIESSSLQLLNDLRQYCPQAKSLFFLTAYDKVCAALLIKQGAAGCISKQSPPPRLLEAIRTIADGDIWVDPALLKSFLNSDSIPTLTNREKNVLNMLVSGKSDKEMALAINLTDRTVRRDIEHLYLKLNTYTRVETAYKAGLLNLLE